MHFLEFYISRVEFVLFFDWLSRKIILKFTLVVVCISTWFPLLGSIPFYEWDIVYIFTCWWIFEFFSIWDYYKYNCYEYSDTNVCVHIRFHFSWLIPKRVMTWSKGTPNIPCLSLLPSNDPGHFACCIKTLQFSRFI